MSDWVCKRCGTICHDMLDQSMNDFNEERMEKEMKRRMEIEKRGEIPSMYCSRCGAQRA